MTTDWKRVTRAAPCPVCEKTDWCGVSADGAAACCMRVQSDHPVKNGGWLHRLKDLPPIPTRRPMPRQSPPASEPTIDAREVWVSYRKAADLDSIDVIARSLGVPDWAMWDMGAGTDQHGNLAMPMRDGHLDIVGIRLRSRDGKKWAVKGSRAGVFIPLHYRPWMWSLNGHAVVVEGPTDAAAVLALRLIPIGRPSCLGCEQTLMDAARTIGASALTVVADNDGPGVMGARRLCASLHGSGIRHRLVTAGGHKDVREWFKSGVDRKTVEMQWAQALWR